MIKLERNFHPLCLSPNEVRRLTGEYNSTGHSVWNFDELKEALLKTSHGKCAYCESTLSVEAKYMEVEHFRDKDGNPDLVVDWHNLLPSCKRCNGAKGTHDTLIEPIVNPYEADPKDHFKFRLYRFRAKSQLGKCTINTLDLNNQVRVVAVRFDICEKIQESLQTALERLTLFKEKASTLRKNRLMAIVQGILAECQPSSAYAASVASMVHSDQFYADLIDELKQLGLWNDELNGLHNSSLALAFETA